MNFKCPHIFNYKSVGKIKTQVTYIEMTECPKDIYTGYEQLEVLPYTKRDAHEYLGLYHEMGSHLEWTGRKLLSENEIDAILESPRVEILLLRVDEEVAGFVEFDLRDSKEEIEIVFFGILPKFYGQKLGVKFLGWCIEYAWNILKCKKLWLHTCDLDHPKALETYLKSGFRKIKEEIELVDQIEEIS